MEERSYKVQIQGEWIQREKLSWKQKGRILTAIQSRRLSSRYGGAISSGVTGPDDVSTFLASTAFGTTSAFTSAIAMRRILFFSFSTSARNLARDFAPFAA